MTIPEVPSGKKPLRWAWCVVIPAVLVALFCIFFGSHLRRELVVRRLESQGVKVVFSVRCVDLPHQAIPGLERYQIPIYSVTVRITDRRQCAALPELLRDIREIGGMVSVDLSGSDDLERDIGRLPATVYHIDVSDREISRSALHQLGKLTELAGVGLQGCKFDNEALAEIGHLKQLYVLALDGSSITDAGLRHLHGLTKLCMLSLSNTQVSESAKEALCKALPKLDLSDD